MRLVLVLVFLGMLGMVCVAGEGWYMEAGPWYRGGMTLDVRGRSLDVNREIGATGGGSTVSVPTGAMLTDDGSVQRFRQFDNGYVGPSGWEWARNDGISQYWAYQDSSQYDAGSGTLTYRLTLSDSGSAERETSRVVAGNTERADRQRADGMGGQATAGWVFLKRASCEWSLFMQVAWLQEICWTSQHRYADRLMVETTTHRSSYDRREEWTYTYDTLGNPAFPAAPYAMSDSSASGPMISDRPLSVQRNGERRVNYNDQVVGKRQMLVISDVAVNAEATSYVLNIGPRLRWAPSSRWALMIQTGLTINLLDAEVNRMEVFSLDSGHVVQSELDRADEQAWLTGVSASCGVEVGLSRNTYLVLSGGYDYVEPHKLQVGPDELSIDLSGYRADVAVGYRFGGE